MNPFYKNLALWLVITMMMIMLYNLFTQQNIAENSISYTEFLEMVDRRASRRRGDPGTGAFRHRFQWEPL